MAFRAALRGFLLRAIAWTESPAPAAPSARKIPWHRREIRVPPAAVAAILWALLFSVLRMELGGGWARGVAILTLTGLVLAFFLIYLRRDHPELLRDEEAVTLLGGLLVGSVLVMTLWVEAARAWPRVSSLGVPIAAAAMLTAILLSARLAVVTAVALGFLYGIINRFSLDSALISFLGAAAGVAAVRDLRARRDIAKAGAWIALVNGLAVLALGLLRAWPAQRMLVSFWWATGGAVLSVAIVSALLPHLEHLFSRPTPMRLLELCDVNHPLLRRMSLEAPGTYHHSLIMASLASAAAEAVGANALLCRAGAYFHDIGKMVKPEYFVENQGALGNPHDPLPPSMSRLVIQSHVKEGAALAKEYGLDQAVADFIGTHHGTSRIEYFYRRAIEKTEDVEEVDEDDYRYPGPKPFSRETAILMLADGVEASVRALSEPTPQRIRDQIKKIVDQKIEDGQFDHVPLTFQDIYRISESFFNTLVGVHHSRVKYPGQDGAGV